jgi:hypothetical protein
MSATSENPEARSSERSRRSSGNGAEPAERLRAYGREAREEGQALLHATQGMLSEAEGLAREQLDARPYVTLGAAFGLGLFLAGGLPFGVVRLAARAGMGIAARQLLAAALPTGAPR